MNQKAACEIPLFSRLTNTGLKKTPTTTKYQSLKNDDKKSHQKTIFLANNIVNFLNWLLSVKAIKKDYNIDYRKKKTIEKYTRSYTDQC